MELTPAQQAQLNEITEGPDGDDVVAVVAYLFGKDTTRPPNGDGSPSELPPAPDPGPQFATLGLLLTPGADGKCKLSRDAAKWGVPVENIAKIDGFSAAFVAGFGSSAE